LAKDELFERAGHGVRPTPRAQELAGPVRRALDIISGALKGNTEFDVATSNRAFNLVLGDSGELVLLPRLMQWLEAQKAGIRITTLSSEGIDARKEMLFGNVDLYLWVMPLDADDDEFVSRQIGVEKNVCLLSREHPLLDDHLDVEQYAELRHVILKIPGSYGPSLIDRELWAHGLKREHSMTVHSFFEFPRIISSTNMIGTVPAMIARSLAKVHKLKILPAPIEFEIPVYLSWPRALDSDPGHRWLREFLIKVYEEL
jgi:DNA-binding transcriptional LysR family regulator